MGAYMGFVCARARGCTMLAVADIATINDIHSAYIHGSVPTAKGESDDIMDLNFPEEVRRGLLGVVSVWCACASGVRGRGRGRGRAR